MLKRTLAFTLALITLFCIVSCGGATPATTEPTITDNDNTAEVTAPSTTGIYDTLKNDIYLDDMEFNVHLSGNSQHTPDDFTVVESGSVMDDAIFEKNAIMAEKYGVLFTAVNTFAKASSAETMMRRSNTAGENEYELCILSGYNCTTLAIEGVLYDMKKLPNVDLSNSWWDQTAIRDLSIANSMFFTTGALSTAIDDFTFCVLFNKELYKDKVTDETNLYALANEGKWTLDELIRISSLVSEDLNGDDIMDSRDMYGTILWDDELLATIKAGGGKIAKVNEDGLIELTMYSERNDNIVNKFVTFANSKYAINFQHMSGGVAWYNMFIEDQAIFMMTMFNECHRFRNMDTDYGILPQPRYSEDQEWYSPIAPWHSAFICVPAVCEDPETIGAVIELLGYHSEQILTPAYYDKTLNGTYVRDEESKDMLDIIFNNRIYDVGHLYKVSNLQETITNLLRNNNPTGLAKLYASYQRASNAYITTINKSIEALKNVD